MIVLTKNMKTRIKDCGIVCMFVEYATDHDGDCFIMYNVETKITYHSCNVNWLHCMYFEKPGYLHATITLLQNNTMSHIKGIGILLHLPMAAKTGESEEDKDFIHIKI